MLAINRDGIPTDSANRLLAHIIEEVNSLNIPQEWKFRKVWKTLSSGRMADGSIPFQANSWVMEFYINDSLYEQFSVHDLKDLHKIKESKQKLGNKLKNV